jgi:hypothetical protein
LDHGDGRPDFPGNGLDGTGITSPVRPVDEFLGRFFSRTPRRHDELVGKLGQTIECFTAKAQVLLGRHCVAITTTMIVRPHWMVNIVQAANFRRGVGQGQGRATGQRYTTAVVRYFDNLQPLVEESDCGGSNIDSSGMCFGEKFFRAAVFGFWLAFLFLRLLRSYVLLILVLPASSALSTSSLTHPARSRMACPAMIRRTDSTGKLCMGIGGGGGG